MTSAMMNPFSKSVWIRPAAWGALVPFYKIQIQRVNPHKSRSRELFHIMGKLWCVCSRKDYLREAERQLLSRHPPPQIYTKHILKPITTQKRFNQCFDSFETPDHRKKNPINWQSISPRKIWLEFKQIQIWKIIKIMSRL